jgi:NAD(P)H-dependent FMN reductase
MSLKLTVIIGSVRTGRVGPKVAEWVFDAAREQGGFDVTLVDLADVGLPLLDEPQHPVKQQYEHDHTKRWAAIVGDADAFLFVTPEYDFFAPASLINAIQYLSQEWKYKPAGIVSYGGVSGGLRSTQMLRLLLSNVNMHAVQQSVSIPFIATHIVDDVFVPPEHAAGSVNIMLVELHKWAAALAPLHHPR